MIIPPFFVMTIKQIGWQANNALDIALADEATADVGLGIATEQHAMRQDARTFASAFQGADDMQRVSVVALFCGRHAERLEALVKVVERIEASAPPLVRKRRIGDDIV